MPERTKKMFKVAKGTRVPGDWFMRYFKRNPRTANNPSTSNKLNPRKLTSSMTPVMMRKWLKELTPAQRENLKEQVLMRVMAAEVMQRPYSKELAREALKNPFFEVQVRVPYYKDWQSYGWVFKTLPEARAALARLSKTISSRCKLRITALPPPTQNPTSLYQDFHGVPPMRTRIVDLPTPKGAVTKIGRLVELQYEPEAPSRRAGKTYTHEMGDTGEVILPNKPILATDGKNLYIIPDKSKARFTERGIIG